MVCCNKYVFGLSLVASCALSPLYTRVWGTPGNECGMRPTYIFGENILFYDNLSREGCDNINLVGGFYTFLLHFISYHLSGKITNPKAYNRSHKKVNYRDYCSVYSSVICETTSGTLWFYTVSLSKIFVLNSSL